METRQLAGLTGIMGKDKFVLRWKSDKKHRVIGTRQESKVSLERKLTGGS